MLGVRSRGGNCLAKKTHATLSPRSAAAGSQAVHKIERRYCILKRFILRYLLVL
jgi:hypothetical protein